MKNINQIKERLDGDKYRFFILEIEGNEHVITIKSEDEKGGIYSFEKYIGSGSVWRYYDDLVRCPNYIETSLCDLEGKLLDEKEYEKCQS